MAAEHSDAIGDVLVVGFARSGQAVARVLAGRGVAVVAVDDSPGSGAADAAASLDVELVIAPGAARLADLVRRAALVVVSPGVPPAHPVFSLAGESGDEGRLISEVELAYRLGAPPITAITGTDGKTTVTSLVALMLERSGRSVVAAGNIGYPLVEAVARRDLDVIVAEVSSFQLALTRRFRPSVGTWLNVAEDHLDWHGSRSSYVAAKARIWANQAGDDVAVANAEDPVVLRHARATGGRIVTFGLEAGDYHEEGEVLVGPGGEELAHVSELRRALPHDRANALAALATARAAGASVEACRQALVEAPGLPHRVELVATAGGVGWYDDSKATTPSAVCAALAGFDSVVLVAGGRNKGLDLGAIARSVEPAEGVEQWGGSVRSPRGTSTRVRAVVAIGEAAGELERAFSGRCELVEAGTMDEAVRAASRLALPGDAVLLSPGCASFDWYDSYEERGDDFARAVRELLVGRKNGN